MKLSLKLSNLIKTLNEIKTKEGFFIGMKRAGIMINFFFLPWAEAHLSPLIDPSLSLILREIEE